jgi:two-component system sensor histidine kinase PilS (NtrC family)
MSECPMGDVKKNSDLSQKLKWLMLFRLLAALLLLGGTIVFRAHENLPFFAQPFIYLYWLSGWIILLSLCYTLFYPLFKHEPFFAYLQIGIDTMIATAIIFLTGSFSSLFTFIYLIVIICSSMFVSRKGGLIIAGLCCLQYGIMVDLEYYEVIRPVFAQKGFLYENFEWNQVLYKMCTVMMACFLTMILSGYLAEKERRAKSDLLAMEDHVKRVERMALVGEMAAGLAHEIKNPLASLSGSIQMLMESDDNESKYENEQKKLMTIAAREAERLNTLVSDFLLFARPVAGTIKKLELGRVCDHTLALFNQHEKYRDRITIVREEQDNLWIEMDSGHLEQVLLNLLINAAEAIGEKNGTINVTSYRDNDGTVRLSIKDDGVGMEERIIKNIFDPFFTTKSKGTGLGLSIVLRILESYNYQINVKSELGVGSEFTLIF